MDLFICGFGGYFVALVVKTVWPWNVSRGWKLACVIAGAFGTAALIAPHKPLELGEFGLSGAGLAVVIHRVNRVLLVFGDHLMTGNIREWRGRNVPR